MKASYKEFDAVVGLQVVHLLPGQFIFGRKKAAEETGLTERQTRTILDLLIKAGNLTIKTTNKFSVISIINWNTYQADDSENDQQNDQPPTNKRPHTRSKALKNKTPGDFSSAISELEKRYSDQETINQTFQAISSTRKSKRIADSVKLSILKSWEKYPVESVMAGVRKYLDQKYHHQGKKENYLLGIIRNSNGQEYKSATPGPVFESSGSALLDKVRRGEIRPVIGGQA